MTALPSDAQPAVGAAERATMLGAFNGGFLMSAGNGGFEIDGHVLAPLVPGLGSMVIDADGVAHVGVWGSQLPTPGEQVVSVRQNLPPLVVGGGPSPNIAVSGAWGSELGNRSTVARSAVGEDAAGDILFAGSMSATPAELADALIQTGAASAMELDINPEWVQAVVSTGPGSALVTAIPGQNRPADQYVIGWTRDFIVASAAI
jgi:Phosphodiester glycosidase